jgi:hypothetical protein
VFERKPPTREYVVPKCHCVVTEFFLPGADGLEGENASLNVVGILQNFSRFRLRGLARSVGKQEGDPSGIVVLYVDAQTIGRWAKLGQSSIQLEHGDTIVLERS